MQIINHWKDIQNEKKRLRKLATRQAIKEFLVGFVIIACSLYSLYLLINYSYPIPTVVFTG